MAKIVDLQNKRTPLGIRLCNPLNIERTEIEWHGLTPIQKHKRFCEFHTLEYGWRAAVINICITYRQRGWDTIEKIITHWAPQSENNTKKYIQYVCNKTGILPDKQLASYKTNRQQYFDVLTAMACYEQGPEWINGIVKDRLVKAFDHLK